MRFWKSWRRFIENQRGAYLVIVAVLLPLLLTFAGLAVDLGRGYAHKAKLQNAADAGVMAAGHIYFPDKSHDEVYEWAQRYMDANHGGEAYNIDQITVRTLKEGITSNDKESTVLISLYASEKVPVSFMAVMGFDAMPVNVVATAKVVPAEQPTEVSGIFSYAFIGANPVDASTVENPWLEKDKDKYSIFFYNNKQRVHGKIHVNGFLRLNGTDDGNGYGQRTVLIDPGSFSTSGQTDRNIWWGTTINCWEHADKKSKTHYYDNDIQLDPGNDNSDWFHMIRIGYDDGTPWGQDVIVDNLEPQKIDISLKQGNDMTKEVYDYLTKMAKTYPKGLNGGTYDSDGIYFSTIRNVGEWDLTKWQSFQYKKFKPSTKGYKVIIADTSIEVNDQDIDYDADHVLIISLHGDIQLNLTDSKKLKALLYAPKGEIIYNGCQTFEGSMVAQKIRLDKVNTTYTWKAFQLDTSGSGSSGSGSGSGSGGSGSSSGTGGLESIILYKDEDPNYGNEQAI